jgi:hypothetical protein
MEEGSTEKLNKVLGKPVFNFLDIEVIKLVRRHAKKMAEQEMPQAPSTSNNAHPDPNEMPEF